MTTLEEIELGDKLIKGMYSIPLIDENKFLLEIPEYYDITDNVLGTLTQYGSEGAKIDIVLEGKKIKFIAKFEVPSRHLMRIVEERKVLLIISTGDNVQAMLKGIQNGLNSLLRL